MVGHRRHGRGDGRAGDRHRGHARRLPRARARPGRALAEGRAGRERSPPHAEPRRRVQPARRRPGRRAARVRRAGRGVAPRHQAVGPRPHGRGRFELVDAARRADHPPRHRRCRRSTSSKPRSRRHAERASALGRRLDITHAALGDAQTANVFVVGMALQAGAFPFAPEYLERALELNGVAVDTNLAPCGSDAFSYSTHRQSPVPCRPWRRANARRPLTS